MARKPALCRCASLVCTKYWSNNDSGDIECEVALDPRERGGGPPRASLSTLSSGLAGCESKTYQILLLLHTRKRAWCPPSLAVGATPRRREWNCFFVPASHGRLIFLRLFCSGVQVENRAGALKCRFRITQPANAVETALRDLYKLAPV